MAGKKICFSDTELAQMFSDYVNRMQGEERHTAAACKEVDDFDTCCQSEFPNNVRLQGLMWDKMMNAAVEYEESGLYSFDFTGICCFRCYFDAHKLVFQQRRQ